MSELQKLELDILELLNRLTLRLTLEQVAKIGECLIEAKKWVPHGNRRGERDRGWQNWLARMGLKERTAQEYIMVAKEMAQRSAPLPESMSLAGFLRFIRSSRRRAWQEELARTRQEAINADLPLNRQYKVVHADCRNYRWPAEIDMVATDPPWNDMDSYRWLGTFAAGHLKEGGLLLVQCGTSQMPQVLDLLRKAGLTYQWLLSIVYQASDSPVTIPPFMAYWRPVLFLSNGPWDRGGRTTMSDTKTVKRDSPRLTHHHWQQPLEPWRYWLAGLTTPGQVIADPFCGSATIGVAVKLLGQGRRYLGTDIDEDHVKVARHRLVEGS